MGLNLIGPTIIQWGTDEQKRYHLPAIMRGEHVWCQGFSEPGAGSDLAALQTRAVDQGDHFVVNGQKVWTSGAHFAHWIILLARTNPDVPKHQGISCFLVPMSTPGISVRPLVLLTGHHHFNEVFFSDVVVPNANLLGPLNQGWKVSTTTLMHERHSSGARNPIGQVARLVALAKGLQRDGRSAWDDPVIRQRLAQLAIDCEVLKLTRFRNLTRMIRGEAPGPEGSILKLTGSELGTRVADAAGELLGMHALLNEPSRRRCPTRRGGSTGSSPRGSTRSRRAPARSSGTSSASACWGCRRGSRSRRESSESGTRPRTPGGRGGGRSLSRGFFPGTVSVLRPVQRRAVQHRRPVTGTGQERLHDEAATLGVADHLGHALRRVGRIDLERGLGAEHLALEGVVQHRAGHPEARRTCIRIPSTLTFSMCPYRDTWVISQNASAALKYISGVGAEPSPPRLGPSSEAKVMWPVPPRLAVASLRNGVTGVTSASNTISRVAIVGSSPSGSVVMRASSSFSGTQPS